MLSREDNERLCRVGPGTPMGAVFRRYWNPVCLAEQLPKPDGQPLRVQILGENLIAFRDSSGVVGLIGEACAHRGVSLALGRVEDGGVRCLYHGWKFNVLGELLETPTERDPRVRARVRARRYPVREAAGLLWAYMGPPDKEPPFPNWRFMGFTLEQLKVVRINAPCNYMQQLDGGSFDKQKFDRLRGRDQAALFDVQTHEYLGRADDGFGQDRTAMKDNWSGIRGIHMEDMAMSVSQGAIVDRSEENLLAADKALVRARRQLLASARRLDEGGEPIGVRADFSAIVACDKTIPMGVAWQSLVPLYAKDTDNA